MGSGSERLVSSDVGERRRDGDSSILGFRGPETEQEKRTMHKPEGQIGNSSLNKIEVFPISKIGFLQRGPA